MGRGVLEKSLHLGPCLTLFTDMFHIASVFKPGAWEGTRAGTHIEKKKYYFFHQSQTGDLFSSANCHERDFTDVILKTCNTH